MNKDDIKSLIKKYVREMLSEVKSIPPKKWVHPDKEERYKELIDLVQFAYKKTPQGSFINSKGDVVPSEWLAIDIDADQKFDATLFYRKSRSSETWKGFKIQGLGHDGSKESIRATLLKHVELLKKSGWWVEASDRIEEIFYGKGINFISDEQFLQKLFPKSNLKLSGDKGKYIRSIGSKKFKETVFGNPILKK